MGATAPIDFEKSLIAPIDFDEKPNIMNEFWQFSCENAGYKETLHPSIKIPKEGPETERAKSASREKDDKVWG